MSKLARPAGDDANCKGSRRGLSMAGSIDPPMRRRSIDRDA
jgi:hypothetical protein